MNYTPDQLARRNRSLWTRVQAFGAMTQFAAFVISLALVIHTLTTGEGYAVTTVFCVAKVLMLYFMTVTGMAWEDEVFGQFFLAKQFFWEDVGNVVSLAGNTLYLATLLLGLPHNVQLLAMCIALATYVLNFAQFAVRGARSAKEKRESNRHGDGQLTIGNREPIANSQ